MDLGRGGSPNHVDTLDTGSHREGQTPSPSPRAALVVGLFAHQSDSHFCSTEVEIGYEQSSGPSGGGGAPSRDKTANFLTPFLPEVLLLERSMYRLAIKVVYAVIARCLLVIFLLHLLEK